MPLLYYIGPFHQQPACLTPEMRITNVEKQQIKNDEVKKRKNAFKGEFSVQCV